MSTLVFALRYYQPLSGDSFKNPFLAIYFSYVRVVEQTLTALSSFVNAEISTYKLTLLEKTASDYDGQDSAPSMQEASLLDDTVGNGYSSGDGDGDKEPETKTEGMSKKKKRTIAGIAGGAVVTAIVGVFAALPGFIVTQVGDIINGKVGEVQLDHSFKYRRKHLNKLSDLFSRDGRLGGRMIAEMQASGYEIKFEPADNNKIKSIRKPGSTVTALASGDAGNVISEYQNIRHPFRISSMKTRRMNAMYNRYGIVRSSLVSPTRAGASSLDSIAEINQRLKRLQNGTGFDTEGQRTGSTEGLTEEEIKKLDDEAYAAAKKSGQFEDLLKYTDEGGDLKLYPDQEMVTAYRQAGTGVGLDLLGLAEKAAKGGSIGGRAFGTIKSFAVSTDIADKLCIIKKRLRAAVTAARAYKSLALIRYSLAFVTASDGIKKGEARSKLVKEVMKRIVGKDHNGNYIGASSGFSSALKGTFSKSKNDSSRPEIAVDGKLTGPMAAIQKESDIPGCSVWQDPLFQIGLAAGEIALNIVTFGTWGAGEKVVAETTKQTIKTTVRAAIVRALKSSLAKSIYKSVAIEISFEGIMTLAEIYAERQLASAFLGQEQGAILGDILVAGAGTKTKQRSLLAGQVPATTTQYAVAHGTYLAEKKLNQENQSVFTRVFDRANPDSLAFSVASGVALGATSPSDMATSISTSAQNLPTKIISSLLNVGSAKTFAEDDDQIAYDTYEVIGGDYSGTELATDIAGNLLTVMPEDILNIEPITNKTELINGGYIDPVTEEPVGVFEEHVKNCVYDIDTISKVEGGDSSNPADDCLAQLPLTRSFKAHLAYLDMKDGQDAEYFPEEISDEGSDGSGGGSGSGTTGITIGDLTGPIIPCEGAPRERVTSGSALNWDGLPTAGSIGKNSAGQDINVYIRDACAGQTTVRTVVIGASIHGSENGGQTVAHELLFNKQLPPDVRIIAIPEINKAGVTGQSPRPRVNKNSVNLNRNFDHKWDISSCDGDTERSVSCKGPSAASEPETQAIQNFLLSVGKSNLVISYHACLNWVGPSGPNIRTSGSGTMAQKYARLIPTSTTVCNGESMTWTAIGNNTGAGFFEAWYAAKTDTPALLVEMNNQSDFEYLNKHADAVVTLLKENVVK